MDHTYDLRFLASTPYSAMQLKSFIQISVYFSSTSVVNFSLPRLSFLKSGQSILGIISRSLQTSAVYLRP